VTHERATTRTAPFLGFLLGCILVAGTAACAAGAGTPGVVPSADGTPIAYEVHVGGDRLILVGHSMGSLVIAEAARLLPGRVLGLIGVDSLHDLDFPVTEEHAAEMIAPLEADFPVACRQFAAAMILPDTDADLAEWSQADRAAAPVEVALSAMRGYMAQWITGAGPALFEELPLPVVAVCADLWPVDAEANRQHMRSFEAIVLEGTDHFLMLGVAEEFNRALKEAIAKIKP